jgi:hypothetical protein
MKKKKGSLKQLTPIPAAAAVFALAASGAHATSPVFDYTFPASWGGTGTTITDQSTAGNNGFSDGTLSLSSSVPTGAAAGTESINTTAGGILTTATGLLNNATVAGAGGFSYNVDFMWNGSYSTSFGGTQKLIDYAGTESLQLFDTSSATSATLQMVFANDAGAESTAVSYAVSPNIWYAVTMNFNTAGNSLVAGDISGIASLYVDGSLVNTGAATKGTYGDGLDRPIGVGQLGANFGYLVGFKGDIYNASVTLVPEPSTLALSLLGGFGLMGMMWNARRRTTES